MNKQALIQQLCDINVIQYGNFTLKSGQTSPVYVDLRTIISYPQLLRAVSESIWMQIATISFDFLCAVPYTALPITTCISVDHNRPMLMKRKEAKAYGTQRMVEGVYQPGQRCIVIEDVVTTGSSIIETIEVLRKEGLIVSHVAAFLDREQQGRQAIEAMGCEYYHVLTLSDLMVKA